MKYLFVFLLTFLLGTLGVIGYGILRKSPGKPIQNIIETASKPEFSIENAPSESIKGSIASMAGDIYWESRTATVSSLIKNDVTLQQGEQIQTGDNGNMNIDFGREILIKVEPKTQISFVQTLPINFVSSIASGSAEFKRLSSTPITVRALHLLIKVDSDVVISIDQDNSLVNLNVKNGMVTAAYNDEDLNSHTVNFNAPKIITFNDLTREFGL